jgi:Xaa-Pro aminopeptidase
MSYAPSAALERRHREVLERARALGVEALLVTALPNILYLTNFTGSSAIVVLTDGRVRFLTDSRYVTLMRELQKTSSACPGFELVEVDGSYDSRLAAVLGGVGGRIGFEAANLTVARHQWLTSTFEAGSTPVTLVPTEGLVERVRVRKDPYESGVLREAARRLSTVAAGVLGEIRAGMTERAVARMIDGRVRETGFERSAFETIVASGPNAALPHARPGERKLHENDLVVLDFGGVYDSYCVDLTRTVSIGPASPRAREVYNAVRDAHDRAIAAVRPGASRFAIDAAARETLDRHGLGEAFGHGTGHGLGLEVHEDPRVTRARPDVDARDEAVLSGMAFTIEPGAYIPGWGGVRIEDDVLVTEDGVEVLTHVTTDLQEL